MRIRTLTAARASEASFFVQALLTVEAWHAVLTRGCSAHSVPGVRQGAWPVLSGTAVCLPKRNGTAIADGVRMKPPAVLVIAWVLVGGCVGDALTPGVDGFPRPLTAEALLDSPLGRDIEAGYRMYGVALASRGQWSMDTVYGVHWCPRATEAAFVPYVSNGHWAPVDEVVTPHAPFPSDVPYWVADDSAGDVTMHHGWWVHDDTRGARGCWCWVPGVEETPARVLWRESDGFVAWAPEPPPSADADDDDDDLLSWVFEFAGTLFDEGIEQLLLAGDGADAADAATHAARARERLAGRRPAQLGPSRGEVGAARTALSEYAAAHPVVGTTTGSTPGERGAPSRTSTDASRGNHMGPSARRLPRPSIIYAQLARDSTHEVESSPRSSLPVIPAAHGGGYTPGLNRYAGRAGTEHGGDCGSHSGGHSSTASSQAGRAGASSGGDCGSHAPHHR